MQNLKITIIQADIFWEKPDANLQKYTNWLASVDETDLIILPEMFTTGFSMNSKEFKETMKGNSVNWMKSIASDKNAAVLGSLIIEEEGKVFNRAVWVFPDGSTQKYDKHHLFAMGQENKHYDAGNEKTIVEYKGWKFCPFICYDLRFPVWNRNTGIYDVVVFMANWPSPRLFHWKTLLTARAIENQSYCIGVNRVGTDGMGLSYPGDSGLVFPSGDAEFMGPNESLKTFEINYNELQEYRKKLPFLEDRDDFMIL